MGAQWRCPEDCETRLGNKWSFTKQWWQCGEKHTCASGQGSVCRCEFKRRCAPNLTAASSPDRAKLDENLSFPGLTTPGKRADNDADQLEAPKLGCLTAGEKCNPNHNTCCTKLGCEYVLRVGYFQCKRID